MTEGGRRSWLDAEGLIQNMRAYIAAGVSQRCLVGSNSNDSQTARLAAWREAAAWVLDYEGPIDEKFAFEVQKRVVGLGYFLGSYPVSETTEVVRRRLALMRQN